MTALTANSSSEGAFPTRIHIGYLHTQVRRDALRVR